MGVLSSSTLFAILVILIVIAIIMVFVIFLSNADWFFTKILFVIIAAGCIAGCIPVYNWWQSATIVDEINQLTYEIAAENAANAAENVYLSQQTKPLP